MHDSQHLPAPAPPAPAPPAPAPPAPAPPAPAPSTSSKHNRDDHDDHAGHDHANDAEDAPSTTPNRTKSKGRKKDLKDTTDALDDAGKKRRCISSACVPCRKRKSKCDGSTPACSACAAVYRTECRYDPSSDHRRKGVYKRDIDNLKTRNSTLQTLVQAILNYPEDDVAALVKQIRMCESLDAVAESILARENGLEEEEGEGGEGLDPEDAQSSFESHLAGKMGDLMLEDGSMRYIGGTSVLLSVGMDSHVNSNNNSNGDRTHPTTTAPDPNYPSPSTDPHPITAWTTATTDADLITHLLNMYFTWHYTFFTTLPKDLFYRDFLLGPPPPSTPPNPTPSRQFCSPLLVNAMLALGSHFTSHPSARSDPTSSATAGDHFFAEARSLLLTSDLHTRPTLPTIQALALMSVREAGCGRESQGWVYSGMSFRMACDLGLHLNSTSLSSSSAGQISAEEEDARRITFWGCFLFDKCWSNYLGRLPQLPRAMVTVPKFDVFPAEEAEAWRAYSDAGWGSAHARQPARTRTVARQISGLCEISADLLAYFYNPSEMERGMGRGVEVKRLSEIHQRLEAWRRELPRELEPREGGLPSMLVMHMFFQLLYIHLFRPFLKYTATTSPLPAHVSPRKLCTAAAATISKLLRLYKRSHGLRQIPNIVVYIVLSACTIHLLNLPDKLARRDIVYGVKHLEEIAEGWLCARRALGILATLARKWSVELPEDAEAVLERAEKRFGVYTGIGGGTPGTSPRVGKGEPVQTAPAAANQTFSMAAPLGGGGQAGYYASAPMAFSSQGYGKGFGSETRAGGGTDFAAYQQQQQQQQTQQQQHRQRPSYPPPSSNHATSMSQTGLPTSSTGNSPRDLFANEGMAPLREGEWYMRDQSQIATGFGNWGLTDADLAYLGGATSGTNAHSGGDGGFTGNVNNGAVGSPSGVSLSGLHGVNFGGLSGLLNENEADWYQ